MEINKIAVGEISTNIRVDKGYWPVAHCEYDVIPTYTDVIIPDILDIQVGVLYKPGVKFDRESIVYYDSSNSFETTLSITPGHFSMSDNTDFYLYGDEAIHMISTTATTALTIMPATQYPILARVFKYNDTRQSIMKAINSVATYEDYELDLTDMLSEISLLPTTITCHKIDNRHGYDVYIMEYFPVTPSSFSFTVITPTDYKVNFFSGIIEIDEAESTADTFTIGGTIGVLVSYYPHDVSSDHILIPYTKDDSKDNLITLGVKQS